jgi:hypothetical protein
MCPIPNVFPDGAISLYSTLRTVQTYIYTFSIYLCCNNFLSFRAIVYFTNPDYRLLRMITDPKLLRIRVDLLYSDSPDTGIVVNKPSPLTTLVDVNWLYFPRNVCE